MFFKDMLDVQKRYNKRLVKHAKSFISLFDLELTKDLNKKVKSFHKNINDGEVEIPLQAWVKVSKNYKNTLKRFSNRHSDVIKIEFDKYIKSRGWDSITRRSTKFYESGEIELRITILKNN